MARLTIEKQPPELRQDLRSLGVSIVAIATTTAILEGKHRYSAILVTVGAIIWLSGRFAVANTETRTWQS